MNNTSRYAVTKDPQIGWSIIDLRTGIIEEGGFSSRAAAQEYIWREYEPTS